jgi:hypothetical protein
MISKSYKDLAKMAQRHQVLRALLTPSGQPQMVQSTRQFGSKTEAHGQSTLVKNVNLNQSMTILNKQL